MTLKLTKTKSFEIHNPLALKKKIANIEITLE